MRSGLEIFCSIERWWAIGLPHEARPSLRNARAISASSVAAGKGAYSAARPPDWGWGSRAAALQRPASVSPIASVFHLSCAHT